MFKVVFNKWYPFLVRSWVAFDNGNIGVNIEIGEITSSNFGPCFIF